MILWAVAILLLTLKAQVEYKGKVHMCVAVNLTLSHLRSKEITHVYLIPMIPGLKLNINQFIFKCT